MKSSFRSMGVFMSIAGAVAICNMPTAYADQPCNSTVVTPGPMNGLPDRVQRLEDIKAIEELKAQYANALDDVVANPANINELLVLFTDDICVDYGPYGRFHGKAAIQTLFQVTVPSITAWNFHVASSPLINVNGNNASGTWQVIADAVFKPITSVGVQAAYANYQDEYTKTSTGWQFSSIIVVFDIPPTSQ